MEVHLYVQLCGNLFFKDTKDFKDTLMTTP